MRLLKISIWGQVAIFNQPDREVVILYRVQEREHKPSLSAEDAGRENIQWCGMALSSPVKGVSPAGKRVISWVYLYGFSY